jgi:HSP20 family protein
MISAPEQDEQQTWRNPDMTIIRRTAPRADVATFRNALDRFFDDAAFRPLNWGSFAESRLPLDITSTEDAITIEAALPGIRPEDVEITVHQDTLTIGVKEQQERESREGERVYREVRRSTGSRTMTLPSGLDIDRATAAFENGMLRLDIPRAEQAKPRQIPVTAVTDAPSRAIGSQAAEVGSGPVTADQA